MTQNKCLCDNCGKDITFTSNCEDWKISVINRKIPSHGGPVTLMGVEPIIYGDLDFCSIKCIKEGIFKL